MFIFDFDSAIFSLPQLKTQLTRCTFRIEQNDLFIYYLQKTIIHITVHVH